MLLQNKTAVVTGCNKGIGKKILEIFSSNKANIFACVRNLNPEFENLIKNLKEKYNNKIIPIQLDLNDEQQIKKAANEILKSGINIDILINNAAVIHTSIFQMTSVKKFKEIFETNFFSQAMFSQYILKSMIKNKYGSIVGISSSSALDANEGRSAYSSSKAAMIAQSKTMSRELGVNNIRVNIIAPGLTDTDMMKNSTPENVLRDVVKKISLRRIAKTEEIANVALFLSSDLASYITGQTIRVDGGM